jgi:hypothetical protein
MNSKKMQAGDKGGRCAHRSDGIAAPAVSQGDVAKPVPGAVPS